MAQAKRDVDGSAVGRVEDWSALLLDDRYFPYFLDFAMSSDDKGLGDIILFLLGADRLRFSADSGCMETIDVAEQYIRSHATLQDITPAQCLVELTSLRSCRIPLAAALSVPCELIWKDYEARLRRVYDNSPAAAPLKKKIINQQELSLLAIVSSNEWKSYFENFISGNNGLWACYNCWKIAVTNIENIRYLRCEELVTASSIGGSTISVEEDIVTSASTPKQSFKNNFLALFQKSSAATPAPSSAQSGTETVTPTKGSSSKPAPPGPSRRSSMDGAMHRWTSASGQSPGFTDNTDYYASVGTCPEYDFTGPYEAFAFLMGAVRGIQSHLGDPTIAASNSTFGSPMSGDQMQILSDATRLELQTVLTMISSVRSTHTVESVEIDYARTCVHRLARLVHSIETETFQCLSVPFNDFLHSSHYLDLMGYIRCTESEKTSRYLNKVSFLNQVRSLGEIHWRDSDDGTYYLKYKHSTGDNTVGPRARPVEVKESSDASTAETVRRVQNGILLCHISPSQGSNCDTDVYYAWNVAHIIERNIDQKGKRTRRTMHLAPIGVSCDGAEGASSEDMETLKRSLLTKDTESLKSTGAHCDGAEPIVAPLYSFNSDQYLIKSFWSLVAGNMNTNNATSARCADCPSTVAMCTLARGTGSGSGGWIKTSFVCGDGEYSSSEMSAVCCSLIVANTTDVFEGAPVPVEIDVSKKSRRTHDTTDCMVPLLCCSSAGTFGDNAYMQLLVDRDVISKSVSRSDERAKNSFNTVLDYYKIAAPRPDWLSRSSVLNGIGNSSYYRGRSVASRSVSLLAVLRLVGGPRNMATLVMMLITGRSLVTLSSSATSAAALRWALESLVYPFPYVHIFKDLTVEGSSTTSDGSDLNATSAVAMLLHQMSSKVNFNKNRKRRQSTEDMLRTSCRDGNLVHPTPVLAYSSHQLFYDALDQMHESFGSSKLSGCFIFDLDSNQFSRHGDETEEELKLLSFCCPSLSYSIHGLSMSGQHQYTTQCTVHATHNLIQNIEKLQTAWSSTTDYQVSSEDEGTETGDSKSQTESPRCGDETAGLSAVVMLGGGNGCRRKLRRASQILAKKPIIQPFSSFDTDASIGSGVWEEKQLGFSPMLRDNSLAKLNIPSDVQEPVKKKKELPKGELLVHKNEMVMRCFQIFVAEVFLRFLPEFIIHYPSVQVIACDVQKLLDQAFYNCPACCKAGSLAESPPRSSAPNAENCFDKTVGAAGSDGLFPTGDSQTNGQLTNFITGVGKQASPTKDKGVASSPHVLFLSSVADSLAFTMLLEEHGVALASEWTQKS